MTTSCSFVLPQVPNGQRSLLLSGPACRSGVSVSEMFNASAEWEIPTFAARPIAVFADATTQTAEEGAHPVSRPTFGVGSVR